MADTRVTSLTALSALATGDVLYVVDVSDTTDNAAGSSRKTTLADLVASLGLARTLFDHYADAGNSGTSETDLYSATLAANTLAANGDKIAAFYSINVTGSATATSQFKVYFAGTARFDSGALSLSSSSNWQCWVEMVRTASTTGRITVSLQAPGAAVAIYTTEADMTSLDFTTTNVIKITGTRAGAGAASNDILAKHGYVQKIPGA